MFIHVMFNKNYIIFLEIRLPSDTYVFEVENTTVASVSWAHVLNKLKFNVILSICFSMTLKRQP